MLQLYKNIKKLRLEQNLSQDDLAKKVGYTSRSTIAKIESGKVDLNESKIKAFADAFNTTPQNLMGWDTTQVKKIQLNKKDEKEIDNYMRKVEEDLTSSNMMFDGEPMDQESLELVLNSMRVGIEMAKLKNKEKYTPKKYRK